MNKLLPVLFLLLSCVVSAEELKFITVLSSPVGSFNKLEAVDPTSAAQGTKVNFCTGLGNGGTVELKGAKDASLGNVNLDSATTLGRTSDGDNVLTNVTLNSGGSLKGSRLLSNVVNINGSAVGKSTNLYSNSLTVAGAKTTGLNVNNKSIMSGTGSAEEMVWSNEYQSDTSCGTNCAKQYLLKEKGTVVANKCPQTEGDPRTWWDESTQQCGCPNTGEYYHNGACCSVSTPKTNTKCWKKTTSDSNKLVWQNVLATERFDTQNIANMGTTRLTCSEGGALGFTGNPKTTKRCPHYSCGGSCVLSCSGGFPSTGGGTGGLTPTPNPDPITRDLGPCSTEGDICVASLYISTNHAGCKLSDGYDNLWCATTYTYSSCVKSTNTTTSYEQLWGALTDTRYSCGH